MREVPQHEEQVDGGDRAVDHDEGDQADPQLSPMRKCFSPPIAMVVERGCPGIAPMRVLPAPWAVSPVFARIRGCLPPVGR